MDIFAGVIASEGFWMLVVAATVAGLVRGFSGFGTAMVYLPAAGQILTPFEALTTLLIMDLIGPLPNIPRAMRTGHPADIMRLSLGTLVALPLGVLSQDSSMSDLEKRWDTRTPQSVSMRVLRRPVETTPHC